MRETSELPPTSLRAPNRHSSSAPNRNIHRETTPNSPSAGRDKMRHNPTECGVMQQKLVRAHEATAFRFLSLPRHSREGGNPFSSLPRHSREGGNPFSSLPHVIPAKAGILSLGTGCPQVAADSTYRLKLPSHQPHANTSNRTEMTGILCTYER